jgi:pimeloyl-ACP methyl ester carboxylesterase
MGRSIDIRDLALFSQPLHVKLLPCPVTEDRAEFTRRMDLDHLLPSISPNKEFSLIAPEKWQNFFASMDAGKKGGGRTEQVVFQAYIPKGVQKLKAAFLLTRHGIGNINHPRLRDFANRNGVALVSVLGNPVQRGFYPVSLIDGDIARLGQMLKHPELGQLPVIAFGHSNGTGFSGIFASQRPDRVIAWISYHSGEAWHLQFPGVEKVPGLAFHGLIDPLLKNGQEATVKHLRQERNAPIAFMLEGNVAHGPVDDGQNATWDFIAAFAEAAMRIRLNEDGALRPVNIEQGWLGANYDVSKGGQQELAIAPYAEFKGDRSIANWLPDKTFAEVWQLYGKTDPRTASARH